MTYRNMELENEYFNEPEDMFEEYNAIESGVIEIYARKSNGVRKYVETINNVDNVTEYNNEFVVTDKNNNTKAFNKYKYMWVEAE